VKDKTKNDNLVAYKGNKDKIRGDITRKLEKRDKINSVGKRYRKNVK
jgi:hypothetical protein